MFTKILLLLASSRRLGTFLSFNPLFRLNIRPDASAGVGMGRHCDKIVNVKRLVW